MELVRERELRETLERQLSMEQKNRGTLHHTQMSQKQLSALTLDFVPGNYSSWQVLIEVLHFPFVNLLTLALVWILTSKH